MLGSEVKKRVLAEIVDIEKSLKAIKVNKRDLYMRILLEESTRDHIKYNHDFYAYYPEYITILLGYKSFSDVLREVLTLKKAREMTLEKLNNLDNLKFVYQNILGTIEDNKDYPL
ncbi:MAG: hypothetical protein MJH09_07750 [Cetobacterium sp.]|nr:hypothetical protein [Cetobacterium sp.]